MTDMVRKIKRRSMWRLVDDSADETTAPLHIEDGKLPYKSRQALCGKSLIGGSLIVGITGEVKVCGRCYRAEFGT